MDKYTPKKSKLHWIASPACLQNRVDIARRWTYQNKQTTKLALMYCRFKGIVHPKMNILSSFTHTHVVPNLHEFLSYAEHKRWYFEEANSCWSPLTSNGSHLGPTTVLLPAFFKISSFMFNIRKKSVQDWNDMRVSKWWQNVHFWVNYPFKVVK